ncbi:Rsph1 [Symbiodinium sp. CCMP2592]|nr:Rsph1 [Symbiodinium sp. CCMP2592]
MWLEHVRNMQLDPLWARLCHISGDGKQSQAVEPVGQHPARVVRLWADKREAWAGRFDAQLVSITKQALTTAGQLLATARSLPTDAVRTSGFLRSALVRTDRAENLPDIRTNTGLACLEPSFCTELREQTLLGLTALKNLRTSADQQLRKLNRALQLLAVASTQTEHDGTGAPEGGAHSFPEVSVTDKLSQTALGLILTMVMPVPGTVELGVVSIGALWLQGDSAGKHLVVEHSPGPDFDPFGRFQQQARPSALKLLANWTQDVLDATSAQTSDPPPSSSEGMPASASSSQLQPGTVLVHNAASRMITVRVLDQGRNIAVWAYEKVQEAHPMVRLVSQAVVRGFGAVAGNTWQADSVEVAVAVPPADVAIVPLPSMEDSSFELEFTYGFGGERPLGRVPARAGMAVSFVCLDDEIHIDNIDQVEPTAATGKHSDEQASVEPHQEDAEEGACPEPPPQQQASSDDAGAVAAADGDDAKDAPPAAGEGTPEEIAAPNVAAPVAAPSRVRVSMVRASNKDAVEVTLRFFHLGAGVGGSATHHFGRFFRKPVVVATVGPGEMRTIRLEVRHETHGPDGQLRDRSQGELASLYLAASAGIFIMLLALLLSSGLRQLERLSTAGQLAPKNCGASWSGGTGETSAVFFVVPCTGLSEPFHESVRANFFMESAVTDGQLAKSLAGSKLLSCCIAMQAKLACRNRLVFQISVGREAVSRSSVQKAVCVLLRCPFFGLAQQRLSPVTQVFFEQRDFRCTDLLRDFDTQLDAVSFEKLPDTELYFGVHHAQLFRGLRHKLLSVLKAILLEAKVLVFPYLGLHMLDSLLQMRGFLIGTTNRIFVDRTAPDLILEVPSTAASTEYSVDFLCKEVKELTRQAKQRIISYSRMLCIDGAYVTLMFLRTKPVLLWIPRTEVHRTMTLSFSNFNGHCKVMGGEVVLVFKDGEEQTGEQILMNALIEKLVRSKGSHDAVILCLMNCCRVISQESADKLVKPNSRSTLGRALVTIWASAFGYPAEEVHNPAGCSTFMRTFAGCIGHDLTLSEMYSRIETAVISHALISLRPLPQQPCWSAQKLPQRSDFFVAAYPSGRQLASTYGRQLAEGDMADMTCTDSVSVRGLELGFSDPCEPASSIQVMDFADHDRREVIVEDQEAVKRFWVPVVFVAASTLHSILVLAWWMRLVKLQRSSRDSFSLMMASFMWACFSYSPQAAYTGVEQFASKFFPLCFAAQAWGQGFIYSDGVELATGSISSAATMAILVGYVVLLMDYGPTVLEEWRARASFKTSRRAFNTWRGLFLVVCGLRFYACQAECGTAEQQGERMHHLCLIAFILGLVYTLVFDCDPTFVSRGRALPVAGFALAFSMTALLAGWCSAFKEGHWVMPYARGVMLFVLYMSIRSTGLIFHWNWKFGADPGGMQPPSAKMAEQPPTQEDAQEDDEELVADQHVLSSDNELVQDAEVRGRSDGWLQQCWGADIRRRLRLPRLLVQAVASAAVLNSQKEQLRQEAAWAVTQASAAVVDADRNAFTGYWIRLLAATAKIAGPERDLTAGLEVASKQQKTELSRFGLPFLQRWVSRTHGGQTWLQAHKLPVPERRPKPPREGHGMYKFANGDEYHGQFRRGMREGAGVYTSKRSHMQYDGQWLRDRRHGTGTLTIESAGKVLYTYDGQWVADKRHGSGSCVRNHKEKYSGQWSQNFYHGAGTFVDEKGTLYEGEWRHGKFHGVGKHICRGETYTGVLDSAMDKVLDGSLRPAAWSVCTGPWNIAPEGHGIMKEPDGRLYEGRFERGAPHGRGYALSLGSKYEGRADGRSWGRAEEGCRELLDFGRFTVAKAECLATQICRGEAISVSEKLHHCLLLMRC